jgi:hypothetical protein
VSRLVEVAREIAEAKPSAKVGVEMIRSRRRRMRGADPT